MTGPGGPPGGSSVDEYHRILTVLSLALMASVVILVGGAWALVATGAFQPFLGFRPPVRIAIGVFLVALLLAAYPLSRAVGGGPRPDAVGARAAVLILLAGDTVLGGTLGALVLVSMGAALPNRQAFEDAVRGLPEAG